MPADGVRIHSAALEEAEAAIEWYGKRSRTAAGAFLNELDRTIAQIAQHPERFQLYQFGTRRECCVRFHI